MSPLSPGNRARTLLLGSLMLCAALFVVAVVFWRTVVAESRDLKLCGTLVYLIERSDKSLDGIDYYKTHPEELALAHRTNAETIYALDCPPIGPVQR